MDLTCVARPSLAPFGLFFGMHRKVATRSKGPFELKRNGRKQLGAYEWAESTVTLLHLILLCICCVPVCLCFIFVTLSMCQEHCLNICYMPTCAIYGSDNVLNTLCYVPAPSSNNLCCLRFLHAGWNLCLQWMHPGVQKSITDESWLCVEKCSLPICLKEWGGIVKE